MRANQKSEPRAEALKYTVKSLPVKDWEMGVSCAPSALDPAGSAHMPIKNCFFVCYHPVGLVDASFTGFQSKVFWGSVP